jgi:hypothetical protein
MISKEPSDIRTIMNFLVLSLLVHLAFAVPLDYFKPFELGPPLLLNQSIMVDLAGPVAAMPAGQVPPAAAVAAAPRETSAPRADEQPAPAPSEEQVPISAPAAPIAARELTAPPTDRVPPEPATARVAGESVKTATRQRENAAPQRENATPQKEKVPVEAALAPLRKTGEFLATQGEKLTYRISMLGIPVGNAELEAKQEQGEVRITLHIQSNPAASQLYPVDDSVETRHIGGNFILSRIRQSEGSFRGDRGFTLFLREKSVFWIDRLKNRSLQEPLPNSAVVDILSGLYYLRNQPLEVGKSVVLEIFDSNRYAPTTVAVLRKEHLTLPGLREVDTLVIHPELKTEGVFRRTGEIMIWLTDDEKRVPVKVETRISLGKVTAELVSAETHSAAAPRNSTRVNVD